MALQQDFSMSESYTVRYAHLRFKTHHKEGDTIGRGEVLGFMGSTGQSTGPHLHIDVVRGRHEHMYRMHNIACGDLEPDFEQLSYFIDEELGGGQFRVTTYPYDYRYVIDGKWKAHPGYDVVLEEPLGKIYWNRSMAGVVAKCGFDHGYGNFIQIVYQA
jgi:murein DD-endopeptidase MepM/ murein hydrolase activator NlpD